MAEVGPVGDVAAAQQDDVLQAVAGHVGQPDVRVGQVDARGGSVRHRGALPGAAGVGVVEPALQRGTGADDVGQSVAVEVDEFHPRVVEADGRRLPVGLERAPAPAAGERHREVTGLGRRLDQQVGPAIAVGVDELHARFAEALRRRLRNRAGQIEAPAAEVAPIAGGGAELDDVGQAAAAQVDHRHRRVAERAGRQARAGDRAEPAPLRLERGVPERQRRQMFGPRWAGLVVDADHLDAGEQGGAVERRLLVAEAVLAHGAGDAVGGVRGHPDRAAPQRCSGLEPGPVIRERVGALFVLEIHPNQERRIGPVAVVGVLDAADYRLVPGVPRLVAVIAGVACSGPGCRPRRSSR